jgi:hypothetical protein
LQTLGLQLKVRLVQKASINTVLTEEVVQFQLPAANTISDTQTSRKAFPAFVLGRTAMLCN